MKRNVPPRDAMGRWVEGPEFCQCPGCGRNAIAKGYCVAHYQRFRKTGDAKPDVPIQSREGGTCTIEGCTEPTVGRKMCKAHYYQLYFRPLQVSRGIIHGRRARKGVPVVIDGANCMEIPLTRGYTTIVDAEDYQKVCKWNWYAFHPDRARTYVARRQNGKAVWMHRQIMDCPEHLQIDHINRNGLDNRRCNLRLATASENGMNKGVPLTKSSKYRGVSFYRERGTWQAQIKTKGKNRGLGHFKTEIEAAKAWDEAAKQRSAFSILNFPQS